MAVGVAVTDGVVGVGLGAGIPAAENASVPFTDPNPVFRSCLQTFADPMSPTPPCQQAVGLDNADGEKRLTRSEHFLLVGGSAETHERMQDTAIRFDEALRQRGKTLGETTAEEAIDLLRRAADQ